MTSSMQAAVGIPVVAEERASDIAAAARTAVPVFLVAKLLGLGAALLAAPSIAGAFIHWDAEYYLWIATNGYPRHLDFHFAFLAGYPLLIRSLSNATGLDPAVAALVVSTAGQFLAIFWIARLLFLEGRTGGVVWLFALWPAAVFLGLIYTEGAFLAAAAAAVFYARAGNLNRAIAWAAVACSIRITGIALIAMLLFAAFQTPGWRDRRWLPLVAGAPLVAFAAFAWLWTGDPLAYLHAEGSQTFGVALAWPWVGVISAWHHLASSSTAVDLRYFWSVDLALLVAAIGSTVLAWTRRGFPREIAVYCSTVLLLALLASNWRSVDRYELALFPLLLLLPAMSRRNLQLVAGLLGAAFAFAAFHYAQGYWIG